MVSPKSWQLETVLELGLWLLVCMAVGMAAVQWLAPGDHDGFLPVLVGTLSFHGAGLGLVALFLRKNRRGWNEAFGFRHGEPRRVLFMALGVTLLGLPATWLLAQASAAALNAVHVETSTQRVVETLQRTVEAGPRMYMAVMAVVLAPVVEEMLFRGILYPAIKEMGYRRVALWSTSILFGMVHANLVTFLPLTFLAVLLVLLYESTDNLLAPILVHSLFNGVNFAILVLGGGGG